MALLSPSALEERDGGAAARTLRSLPGAQSAFAYAAAAMPLWPGHLG
jgi:hypothetical protein